MLITFVVPESKIAMNVGVAVHDVTEGGIFGALWEIAADQRLDSRLIYRKYS